MRPPPHIAPYVPPTTDGELTLFLPAGDHLRVYQGKRGVAVTLPEDVWREVIRQLTEKLAGRPAYLAAVADPARN
jgi:hypothetical protein